MDCVLDPKETFGVESYAALAEKKMAEKEWGEAMWAARLFAATEDEEKGQRLTDVLLKDPEVIEHLRRVRRRPDTRDKEFGKGPGLRKWLSCEPEEFVPATE